MLSQVPSKAICKGCNAPNVIESLVGDTWFLLWHALATEQCSNNLSVFNPSTSSDNCQDKIKVMFVLNCDVLYILADNYSCTPSAEAMSVTEVFAAIPANSTGKNNISL